MCRYILSLFLGSHFFLLIEISNIKIIQIKQLPSMDLSYG